MRPDFGRCVIERERSGSSNPSAKARMIGRINEDGEYEGPARIPTSRNRIYGYFPKLGEKDFTDVLGPIKGYLHSRIGWKWDDVYSELSQGLGKFSWPMRHVLTAHIHVAVNTFRGEDGRVYVHDDRYSVDKPIDGSRSRDFYVHPETRTLRKFQSKKERRVKAEPVPRWPMKNGQYLVLTKGLWYVGEYETRLLPGDMTYRQMEAIPVVHPDYRRSYYYREVERFRIVRSASKKEIKKITGESPGSAVVRFAHY